MTTAPALVGSVALARALGVEAVERLGALPRRRDEACVVGPAAGEARAEATRFAQKRGIPLWIVGSGPFRPSALGPHATASPTFAFRLERVYGGVDGAAELGGPSGLGEDARAARAESIVRALEAERASDPALLTRARACIARFVAARVSTDEHGLDPSSLPDGAGRVLVIADEPGLGGRAEAADRLREMLAHARELASHASSGGSPEAPRVWLFDAAGLRHEPQVHGALAHHALVVLPEGLRPLGLFDAVAHVVVGDSDHGFEALLHGKPVTCFGRPFYAGWGLTRDALRGRARTLDEVFAAAFLVDAHYVDPESGAAADLERAIEHIALQRRYAEPFGTVFNAFGFSPWKRTFVPAFLGAPPNRLVFEASAAAEREPLPLGFTAHEVRIVWGPRSLPGAADASPRGATSTQRMEDGFLRSVGLGSDFHAPASLVVDSRGIYFDPSAPSDLEWILENVDFDDAERARAARLRERIVRLGVSKYNVGTRAPFVLPSEAATRRKLLVVGQVEDDASIRLGCVSTRTNAALLEAARAASPDAFILWKPHPDVASGNREGHVPPEVVARVANMVVTDVAVGECLAVVDEVHTMTSLVGFEALLRGLRVAVHGQPFYAGWGLTEDLFPHPRRTRRRTLDELVAATLIRYPRYVHPTSLELSTPEAIVDHLVAARGALAAKSPTMGSRLDGWLRAAKLVVTARVHGGRRGR